MNRHRKNRVSSSRLLHLKQFRTYSAHHAPCTGARCQKALNRPVIPQRPQSHAFGAALPRSQAQTSSFAVLRFLIDLRSFVILRTLVILRTFFILQTFVILRSFAALRAFTTFPFLMICPCNVHLHYAGSVTADRHRSYTFQDPKAKFSVTAQSFCCSNII